MKNKLLTAGKALIICILAPVLVALILISEFEWAPLWISRLLLIAALVSAGVAAGSGFVLVHRDDTEIE